ncbi:MAG: hypothetical protein NXI13_02335 [Proteobacteria bacterium]|nr:hypothetical protein [Pseudomonadota bacterium]
MAYAIPMIQPTTRKRTIGYTGVSWTCLFFGPFPALYRKHIFGFIGMTLVNIGTLGLSALVFAFVYNAWHYHSLLSQGFLPTGHQFGNVAHNVSGLDNGLNDNLDTLHSSPELEGRRGSITLASPELSEHLIDDHDHTPIPRKP